MPSPTFVSYQDSGDWTTSRASGSTYTVSSVSVQSVDVLVVVAGVEIGTSTWTTPAGGGLTYTLQESQGTGTGDSKASLWTATASSTTSFNITSDRGGTGSRCAGLGCYVFRNAAVGANIGELQTSGAPSLAITTTADNSAIVWLNTDFDAGDGAARTWNTINSITPTSGNGLEKVYQRNAAAYTVYSAYWNDVGAAESKTAGNSIAQDSATVLIEIQGVAAADQPRQWTVQAPSLAAIQASVW